MTTEGLETPGGGVPAGSQRQLLIFNKQTHHMAMGKLKSILSIMALIASGVAAASSPASAGDQCSVATMKGSYLYAQDGIILGTLPDKNKPFAQAGREYFDGKGSMSGIYSGNFNGIITRGSYKGTYKMNSNCSGTVTFQDDQKNVYNYDIFATQNGSEFVFVQTDSNSITAAFERRRDAQ